MGFLPRGRVAETQVVDHDNLLIDELDVAIGTAFMPGTPDASYYPKTPDRADRDRKADPSTRPEQTNPLPFVVIQVVPTLRLPVPVLRVRVDPLAPAPLRPHLKSLKPRTALPMRSVSGNTRLKSAEMSPTGIKQETIRFDTLNQLQREKVKEPLLRARGQLPLSFKLPGPILL